MKVSRAFSRFGRSWAAVQLPSVNSSLAKEYIAAALIGVAKERSAQNVICGPASNSSEHVGPRHSAERRAYLCQTLSSHPSKGMLRNQ